MGVDIHPSAHVSEEAEVGEGTKVWHEVQIREGAKVGKNCTLGKSAYIGKNVIVGDDCKIQNRASLYQGVKIGHDVFIGPHVIVTNDPYPRADSPDWKVVETVIEDWASIGANSTILCGIKICEHAMIGAGSVVTKDVGPHELVMGNPATGRGYVCSCGRVLDENYHCSHCGKTIDIGAL